MTVVTTNSDGTEGRYQAVRALALDSPTALPELVRHLSDESWRVRKAAVDRLVEITPSAAAIPALVEVLDHPGDVPARNAAAEALARMGFAAVPALARLLAHANADARKFAADILGVVGHHDAVDPLARALEDPDRNVRASAAEALGKIGGARAGLALERALALPDHLLRVSVLDGLWRIGAVPDTGVLEALARDRYLRRPIYRLLGRSHDPRALAVLVVGLGDPGRSTREAALGAIAEQARVANGFFWGHLVLALRRSGMPLDLLARSSTEALGRDDVVVGEGALLVLGALGRAADVRVLVEAGSQARYREVARAALGGMGREAIAPLVGALAELAPAALGVAAEFLGPGSGTELEPRLLAALDLAAPDLVPLLIDALGMVGTPGVVRSLAGWSRAEEYSDDIAAALEAVAQRRPQEALAAARAEWQVRPSAVIGLVLGAAGGEAEVPVMVAALRHADPMVRRAAARALEQMGASTAVEPLRASLTDESEEVRAACLKALGALRPPDLEDLVRLALKDPAPSVSQMAARVAGEAVLGGVAADLPALLDRPHGGSAMAALDALDRLEQLSGATLERASEHAHPDVCLRALTLSASRAEGLELVRRRLRHPRWEVRRAAARIAGTAGTAAELAVLKGMADSEPDPLVAESVSAAISALEARARS